LSHRWFPSDFRADGHSSELMQVREVSPFVVKVPAGERLVGSVNEIYALDDDRPVRVRTEGPAGNRVHGSDEKGPTGGWTITDVPYFKRRLDSGSPTKEIEALDWLGIAPTDLSWGVRSIGHAYPRDIVEFWNAAHDPSIVATAKALEGSDIPWVAQAAKDFSHRYGGESAGMGGPQHVTDTLKIQDLVVGQGTEFCAGTPLKIGERAMIEYDSALPDGTAVNVSNEPSVLEAGGRDAVAGLSDGILGMRAGGTRRVTVPSRMAYSGIGAGQIPPDCDVIYTVKLLHIAREEFGTIKLGHDINVGTGSIAKPGMRATVRWTSWRLDGTPVVFSSTPDGAGIHPSAASLRNPIEFDLDDKNNASLAKAIVGMRVGGVRRTLVTDGLAYLPSTSNVSTAIVQFTLERLEPKSKTPH
jgi:FKBP-type peptidyl-prolyl cis-trans isomerase FkpA